MKKKIEKIYKVNQVDEEIRKYLNPFHKKIFISDPLGNTMVGDKEFYKTKKDELPKRNFWTRTRGRLRKLEIWHICYLLAVVVLIIGAIEKHWR